MTPATRRSFIAARARILPAHEQHVAQQVMDATSGWKKQLFALIWRLQGRQQIYLAITPTEE